MRPLYLRFSGLHSYEAAQEIDFDALGDSGLFGIFGPTGSGKSTVLDAMTLALYGRVERSTASSPRRGILNQHSRSLSVLLDFRLGRGSEQRVYRVERSYVRHREDELSVRNTRSVLLQRNTGGEWDVLEDKDTSVNSRVYQLLGLSHDDFSRAVVLPQGKFAEFLSLAGPERRQMLQRLFSLERYGDQLAERLRDYDTQVTAQLGQLQTQLEGLGDASQEAVDALRTELEEAESQLGAVQRQVEYWQDRKDRLQQWRRLQEQRIEAEQALDPLEQSLSEMNELQERLQRAEEVESYRQLLRDEQESQATLLELGKRKEHLEQGQRTTEEQWQKADAEYQRALKVEQEQLPTLMAQRERFRRAERLEQAVAENERHATGLRGECEQKQAEMQEMAARFDALQTKHAALQEQRLEVRAERTALRMDPKYRQWLDEAAEAAKEWMELDRQWKRHCQEIEKFEAEETAAAESLQKADATRREWLTYGEDLETQQQRLRNTKPDQRQMEKKRRWLANFSELVSEGRQLCRQYSRLQEDCQAAAEDRMGCQKEYGQLSSKYKDLLGEKAELERALDNAKHQAWAQALAKRLQRGIPCPVCGSREHPHAAGEETQEWDRLNEAWDRAVAAERQLHGNMQRVSERLSHRERDQRQAEKELARLNQTWHTLKQRLPEAYQGLDMDELETTLEREEQELHQEHASALEWQERAETLEQEKSRWEKQRREVESEYAKQHESWQRIKTTLDLARATERESREKLQQAALKLNQVAGDWSAGQILDAHKEAAEKVRRQEQLDEKLDGLDAELTATAGDLETARKELHGHERTLDALEHQLRSKQDALTAQQDELHEALNSYATSEAALAAVNQTIKRLEANRSDWHKERDELREAMQENQIQLQSVLGQLEAGNEQLKRLRRRLDEAVTACGFEDRKQLQAALVDADTRRQWQQRLTQFFRDYHYWTERCHRLREQLAEAAFSEDDWTQCQQALEAAEKRRDQMLSHRGELTAALKDLEERHRRWAECKEREARHSEAQDLVRELRAVLKGNAFVEYLAERQLQVTAQSASEHLGQLTNFRYALEIHAGSGFVMRDDANGGQRRPAHTLSGGETFLTSLALALALSRQIQLRGRYPLEFFFLDEGFGSLDEELLDLVITSLEVMDTGRMLLGVISHVGALKERISRRIVIEPAVPGERGSTIAVETA